MKSECVYSWRPCRTDAAGCNTIVRMDRLSVPAPNLAVLYLRHCLQAWPFSYSPAIFLPLDSMSVGCYNLSACVTAAALSPRVCFGCCSFFVFTSTMLGERVTLSRRQCAPVCAAFCIGHLLGYTRWYVVQCEFCTNGRYTRGAIDIFDGERSSDPAIRGGCRVQYYLAMQYVLFCDASGSFNKHTDCSSFYLKSMLYGLGLPLILRSSRI